MQFSIITKTPLFRERGGLTLLQGIQLVNSKPNQQGDILSLVSIKRAESTLLYGCTIWELTKPIEKKLDGNYTRMLQAILNKSWKQHPTKQLLYGYLLPMSKTIYVRQTRHVEHCWRSKAKHISDFLWTPTYGHAHIDRPAKTYVHQLCMNTGCVLEDLPRTMVDWDW